MMKGDDKGMMEYEALLKTPLNLTSNLLGRTHQAPLRLYRNSYRNPSTNGRDATPHQGYGGARPGRRHHKGYEA
jgi:hypothetical protein